MHLTPNQDAAMQLLSNYVGQTVDVLTSVYDANVAPEFVKQAKGYAQSTALRGLESKGFIRIEAAFWKGATVTVLKGI